MRSAGLIFGPESHHLDHLAPLCALREIPLILTEASLAEQAKKYYPDLKVLLFHPFEAPEKIVTEFDAIFYSTPRVLLDEMLFFAEAFHKKRVKTIWCPHGNSDKGRNSPFMEALKEEELLLTYGPRMEAFLKDKGVAVPTKRVGNYRLEYYRKHQEFYDQLAPKSTFLYAPTWQDGEKNSSFPNIWKELANFPDLLVKLHPNLYKQFPNEIESLKASGVQFIEKFPPVYPLLANTQMLIGDVSSICYDFLAFQKPMVLLKDSPLSKVGRLASEEEYPRLVEICKEELGKTPDTKALYEETFSTEHQLQER